MDALSIAAIQMAVTANKDRNLEKAGALIRKAVKEGANMVVLPEIFNSPLDFRYFADFAERIPGKSTNFLSELAAETKAFIIGGSIVEEDEGNYYNTSTVFDPEGIMIAKHRKMHLFDVDIPGKITIKESGFFKAGNDPTTFDTHWRIQSLPFCKVGLAICYDMRFPELAQIYTKLGCKLIVYPAACSVKTGDAHWKAIQRGRAIDNQLYVVTVSPAVDKDAEYVTWGHSMIVSPWGEVIVEAQEGEEIIKADIDVNRVDEVRQQIPVFHQKRTDVYQVNFKES